MSDTTRKAEPEEVLSQVEPKLLGRTWQSVSSFPGSIMYWSKFGALICAYILCFVE